MSSSWSTFIQTELNGLLSCSLLLNVLKWLVNEDKWRRAYRYINLVIFGFLPIRGIQFQNWFIRLKAPSTVRFEILTVVNVWVTVVSGVTPYMLVTMLLYITSQKTVMLASTDIAACSLLLCFHVEPCLEHVFVLSCSCFMYFSHFVILSCHLFTTLWSETDLPLTLHNTGTFQ